MSDLRTSSKQVNHISDIAALYDVVTQFVGADESMVGLCESHKDHRLLILSVPPHVSDDDECPTIEFDVDDLLILRDVVNRLLSAYEDNAEQDQDGGPG